MADDSFRTEFDARFSAVDARVALNEAKSDAKFAELVGKIERLIETVQADARRSDDYRTEIKGYRAEIISEGRTTRMTIIVTLITVMIAAVAAIWTAQANLLAAFQAGLARQAVVSAAPAPTPPSKASLADAR